MPRVLAARSLLIVLVLVAGAPLTGCGGGGDGAGDVALLRARQAKQAAREAGLPDEAGDVLALAAASVATTYTVTYRSGQSRLTVVHDPPRRRVDVSTPGQPDERTIEARDETVRCTRTPKGWRCQADAATSPPGAFSTEALRRTISALTASRASDGSLAIVVEGRSIANAAATCIVALDTKARLCVSAHGVPLLLEGVGDRDLVAVRYRAAADGDAFERPDR